MGAARPRWGMDGLCYAAPTCDKSKFRAARAFYLFCGPLAQHRPEYAIPQRCADAVVSRCELMMTLVVLKQW
jgi:hypothetical protein